MGSGPNNISPIVQHRRPCKPDGCNRPHGFHEPDLPGRQVFAYSCVAELVVGIVRQCTISVFFVKSKFAMRALNGLDLGTLVVPTKVSSQTGLQALDLIIRAAPSFGS